MIMHNSRCLTNFATVSWGVRLVLHTRDFVGCREARVLFVFAELLTMSVVHVHWVDIMFCKLQRYASPITIT